MQGTILVVNRDRSALRLLAAWLMRGGFAVATATDDGQALAAVAVSTNHLVLLDRMASCDTGAALCRAIRALSDVPIIVVADTRDAQAEAAFFESGADDVIARPFNPRELTARIGAVLRRSGPPRPAREILRVGEVTIDTERREIRINGALVAVRRKAFALLVALARAGEREMSRAQLFAEVWGCAYDGRTRKLDVQISVLRAYLAGANVFIESVRGSGYRLRVGL